MKMVTFTRSFRPHLPLARPPRQTPTLRGELRRNEPLAGYTTWRVGGRAERLFRPAACTDLAIYIASRPRGEPLLWLGLGSNLLVRDGGVRGSVILTGSGLGRLRMEPDGSLYAEAGVPCNKLARFAVKQGLSGAEFLAGIPGTLGGALAMNAGAWGGETWPLVAEVQTLDRWGVLRRRPAQDFQVGYRQVKGPGEEWFTAAWLRLASDPDGASAGQARIKALLAQRAATQPTGVASAGSVFRNPPGDHAGRLVEACGLKGTCRGAACISTQHGNFIVNTGNASAADIEALINLASETVAREQGVQLVPEVRIVGEPPIASQPAPQPRSGPERRIQ